MLTTDSNENENEFESIHQPISIGQRIKALRKARNLGQVELLGGRYSKTYLSRIETDRQGASQEFLEYVAARLEVPVTDLQTGEHLEIMTDAVNIRPRETSSEDTSNKENNNSHAQAANKSSSIGSRRKGDSKKENNTLSVTRILSKEEQELELKNAQIAFKAGELIRCQAILDGLNNLVLHSTLQPLYHFLRGQLYIEHGDEYMAALLELNRALELYEAAPKTRVLDLERVRNSIGTAYYRQSNFVQAVEYHQRCWQAIKNGHIDDQHFKMQIYYNLANDYFCLNSTKQALHLYREAAKIADQINKLADLAGIYWGMALAYRAKGNLSRTKLFFDRSANLYEDLDQLKLSGAVRGLLGVALLEEKDYASALQALRQALEIAEQLADKSSTARTHINLSYLFLEQGEKDKALEHAQQGVEKAQIANDSLVLGQGLAQLADALWATGQAEESLKLYAESIELLEKTGSSEYLNKVYPRYAKSLEEAGNLKEALAIYHKAMQTPAVREPI